MMHKLFRRFLAVSLLIIAICLTLASSYSAAQNSPARLDASSTVFFYGSSSFAGTEVHQWTSDSSPRDLPDALAAKPLSGTKAGFVVKSKIGEAETISGIIEERELKLSNGAVVRISEKDCVYDLMVKLKLLYLKLYRPNNYMSG